MIPSRGLRSAHFAPLNRPQSAYARSVASRQFSSIPRTRALPAASNRPNTLLSTTRRTGTLNSRNAVLNASAVRYGSWYAPWTWGGPGSKAAEMAPTSEFASEPARLAPESTVTTATPELAPGGIDKAAVVESTAAGETVAGPGDAATMEDFVDQLAAAASGPGQDPTTAITTYGALKDMGLDYGWGPSSMFEWLVEHAYIMSGMGWGCSILAATLTIRAGTFYFQARSSDAAAKIATIDPLIKPYQNKMNESKAEQDVEKTQHLALQVGQIYKQLGASPFKTVVPMLVQGVAGFGAFRCIRGMSSLPVPGMSEGGFLWFKDLTVSDPYFVLPIASSAVFVIMAKIGGETGQTQLSDGQKIMMTYALPTFMLLVTVWQPAGIQLYLFLSAFLGTMLARLLRVPAIRRTLNLTPTPTAESKALWQRVANKELPLSTVWENGKFKHFPTGTNPDKIYTQQTIETSSTTRASKTPQVPIYQAPSTTPSTRRGLNLKSGTSLPAHLSNFNINNPEATSSTNPGANLDLDPDYPHCAADYNDPPSSPVQRIGWIARNYRPRFLVNRLRIALVKGNASYAATLMPRKGDAERARRMDEDFRRRAERARRRE